MQDSRLTQPQQLSGGGGGSQGCGGPRKDYRLGINISGCCVVGDNQRLEPGNNLAARGKGGQHVLPGKSVHLAKGHHHGKDGAAGVREVFRHFVVEIQQANQDAVGQGSVDGRRTKPLADDSATPVPAHVLRKLGNRVPISLGCPGQSHGCGVHHHFL